MLALCRNPDNMMKCGRSVHDQFAHDLPTINSPSFFRMGVGQALPFSGFGSYGSWIGIPSFGIWIAWELDRHYHFRDLDRMDVGLAFPVLEFGSYGSWIGISSFWIRIVWELNWHSQFWDWDRMYGSLGIF